MLAQAILKSDAETIRRMLRLIPNKILLAILKQEVFSIINLKQVIKLVGVLLQSTDEFNLVILRYLMQSEMRGQMQTLLETANEEAIKAIVRCMLAQPVLCEVWDFSPLIQTHFDGLSLEMTCLVHQIQVMTGMNNLSSEENQTQLLARIQLVETLTINKVEETRCKDQLQNMDYQVSLPLLLEESQLVCTEYLATKAQEILNEMERNPFGHFSIRGAAGSGKMTLVKIVDLLYQQKYTTSNGIIVVTLESTFDSKNLVGTYVCNETGEFQFKKGPLTVAAENGLWLVLRNIEDTPSDLLSFLLPIIQENTLQLTSTMTIKPRIGFRIFVLQKTNYHEEALIHLHEDIEPLLSLMFKTELKGLCQSGQKLREDFEVILSKKFPSTFLQISDGLSLHDILKQSIEYLSDQLNLLKPHLLDFRPQTVNQLLQLYSRIEKHFNHLNGSEIIQISQQQRVLIIEEISDVYLGFLYDIQLKERLIQDLVQNKFNSFFESVLDGNSVSEYCTKLGRNFGISNESCFFGRVSMQINPSETNNQKNFVYTAATVRLLEQATSAITMKETLLLVGETGTGKTTVIQEIANISGNKLHVFNMNQNTDSADLMGGFKPVDLKYLLKPVYELFLHLFSSLFEKTQKNQEFLDLTQKCYQANKVKEFCKCLQHGLGSIKKKNSVQIQDEVLRLENYLQELQKRTKKLESSGGFIFQFVEGTLIKSMQNGDWVLLDEINLASESVLNRLATIIQGDHVMLNERADIIDMQIHPNFRLFMCMNPPYSSAGKKQLTQTLRLKLTEIYVPELQTESDLWLIIDKYTKNNEHATINEEQKRLVLQFYIQIRQTIQKQTKRGNIGLRNLCRSLRFMNQAIGLKQPVLRAIHDSLFTCFASHLDTQLQEIVQQLILSLFKIRSLPKLSMSGHVQDQRYTLVEDTQILLGNHKPVNFNPDNFILTQTFKKLLQQLASVISVSDFAIILEGPTSAGKTSCINYLAAVTHNHVIRINNHMHTDVQEYIGSYVPNADTGKLVFQEGILVEAVRKGYWVILDELNLAPSEVLEALNRLLDDNREIHIVETQKVVKAHPSFRIFATQNPTEGYGGRKELSEAFKNRFVMIKVRDVPTEELKQILEQKCYLPKSRVNLMVKVMENLQIYRSQNSIFAGKDSIITVRDLLKWAGRINLNSNQSNHMDMYQIALEGFLVLAERSRDPKDKEYIKQTIEKVFEVKLQIETFYESFFQEHLAFAFNQTPVELNLPPIIFTKQFKRLATLVYKCLLNKEPVLMVGETGCGKTTLCQVIAHSLTKQQLFSINCHQNTETSDFIGCMRTRKNLSTIQENLEKLLQQTQLTQEQMDQVQSLVSLKKKANFYYSVTKNEQIQQLLDDLACIFEWTDGILVNAMQQGGLLLIDEISLANDSVLERLNSVFEQDRTLVISEKSSAQAVRVVANQKFNMVATMNPGSDFGKKELSPALRNRMTEIWVESYFVQNELVALYQQQNLGNIVDTSLLQEVDLNLIIFKLCEAQLPTTFVVPCATAIFNLICFVNFPIATKYFSMQRKALSIRDILNLIDFIKTNTQPSALLTHPLDLPTAFKHAAELVIIDGLCLGIDVSNLQEQQNITNDCTQYLNHLLSNVFKKNSLNGSNSFINTSERIGVSPFVIGRTIQKTVSEYAFEAESTKSNLMKLLRAFTLGKPLLIEGPPGVGKTSLVENLAKQTGRKLIRVNLSEQTDMMDLLGSEYPTANSDEEDEIKFSWCDGVLLQAIKNGYWFLIDEMNLAQQSILEGLNAILDHRRTVYIPELNREFVCHPDFFVFACQNPSQSSGQTSGRKTLPKSFLNRFSKIYLDDLTQQDYRIILRHQAKQQFSESQIEKLLEVTQQVNLTDANTESEGKVNMRDLSRFLKLQKHFGACEYLSQNDRMAVAFEISYRNIQKAIDGNFIAQVNIPKASLLRTSINQVTLTSLHQTNLSSSKSNANNRSQNPIKLLSFSDYQDLKGAHTQNLQYVTDCLQADIPLLVVTNDPQRFVRNLSVIAQLHQTKMKRILLNDRSDTTQLLGCFEQTSNDIGAIMQQINLNLQHLESIDSNQVKFLKQETLRLQYCLSWETELERKLQIVNAFVETYQENFRSVQQRLNMLNSGNSRFEWVDSVLVQSVLEGHWAVFENANLCNPSILDRLNGLIEEGSQYLTINEQGLVGDQMREVRKHENFRAIFVMSQQSIQETGKDISRALRNRCLAISVNYEVSELGNQFDQLNGKKICIEEKIMKQQILIAQEQHDYLPLKSGNDEILQKTVLGKRNNPETNTYDVASLQDCFRPIIDRNLLAPYKFFMCLLNQQNKTEPFIEFINSENKAMQQTVGERLETQVIDRNLKRYLEQIINLTRSENPENLFILLKSLLTKKNFRDIFSDAFVIFVQSLTAPLIKVEIPHENKFIQDSHSVDFELLKSVQEPDQQLIESFRTLQQQIPHCDLYVYKTPFDYIFTKHHESRFSTIVRMLKFNQATLIMLDAEKEIIKDELKIVKQLEENCFDMGTVLETPNLVVIPSSLTNGVIVMTQSFVYESLCFVKDFLKLQSGSVKCLQNWRLTKIPQIVRLAKNQHMACLLRQLSFINLERSYSDRSYQINLIAAVVNDEKSIAMKDLPAAYACSHSLISKLQKLDSETNQSKQFQDYLNLVDGIMTIDCDTQIRDALLARYQSAQFESDQYKNQASIAINHLAKAFSYLSLLKTSQIIKAMFILPLEISRQTQSIELKNQEIQSERFFWEYHYKEKSQPEFLVQPKLQHLQKLQAKLDQLSQLNMGKDFTQSALRQTLQFVDLLHEELVKVKEIILTQDQDLNCDGLASLVFKQFDSLNFVVSSNLLSDLLLCIVAIVQSCRTLVEVTSYENNLTKSVVGLKSDRNLLIEMCLVSKDNEMLFKEYQMQWLLKQTRFDNQKDFKLRSHIFEHFIQREVIKRMTEEEKHVEIFKLPFKLRTQTIPEITGKAMDEWTEKDKAKMEAQAEAEIELNFPSYFDEVQKAYYSGELTKEAQQTTTIEDITIQDVMGEFLEISPCEEQVYRQQFLRERLVIVQAVLENETSLKNLSYKDWIDDVVCYLQFNLHEQKLKQVMNISEVKLSKSYNFYHSPFPEECKLVYQPLVQLQMRLRDVTIRDEYESPLLNEAIFLSNYILTCFNIEVTPLMKVLTTVEFLLTKLEEWENTYASKRLNSLETEINQFKLLIIRYRKIQILSWRNLLNWKQENLIRDDVENCVRLAHTITKQIFDGKDEMIKVMDLLDLYIRDSTLGIYRPRLRFLEILKEHLETRQSQIVRIATQTAQRLQEAINSLSFVITYYSQFKPKLQQTIDRLDGDAREKVKTLIDISKWTLQKFSIMKSNVDRTHRQLNKACKTEEEILIQNVQSLVLASSRKKFAESNDQLIGLDSENQQKITYPQSIKQNVFKTSTSFVKQLQHLESSKLFPFWPSCLTLQNSISGFMERMAEVRALNKKYLQRKAFFDLLKFMKDEGLRSNFQTEFNSLLLKSKSSSTYFVKAYETFTMLKNSSQADENSDLKNVDVLRIQGFSQHLMHITLEMNLQLQEQAADLKRFDFVPDRPSITGLNPSKFFILNKDKAAQKLLEKQRQQIESFVSKIGVAIQLTQEHQKKQELQKIYQLSQNIVNSLPTQVYEFSSCQQIIDLQSEFRGLLTLKEAHSRRVKNMFTDHSTKAERLAFDLEGLLVGQDQLFETPVKQVKKYKLLENKTKVFYQVLTKLIQNLNVTVNTRTESVENNSTTECALNDQLIDEQPDLTIEERLKFVSDLNKIFKDHLPGIVDLSQKILKCEEGSQTAQNLEPTIELLRKIKSLLSNCYDVEKTYIDSMSKFAYLSQRVFLYLIYQGFCGQDDSEDPEGEPPSDLEQDGMGMGDGKGGQNNVTDQIEHEEQLEGLKNYESDEDQKQEQDNENEGGDDQDDNDFEMKEDFDGEMDSEQKSNNSQKQDEDEDDQMDEVDDLLDNQLWNKNMEDMEEQEKNEQSEERREQDLGERELQDENKIENDSQMAEGDHDEREQKDEQEQQQKEQSDQEMAPEDISEEGEKDSQGPDEDEEMGINNESVPADADENFSEESKSEEGQNPDQEEEKSNEDAESIDSKFEEQIDDQKDLSEGSQMEDQEDDSLDVKNQPNQAVLEDDQIQANQQKQDKKNDQANLKKQQDSKVEESNNNNQEKMPEQVDSQQVDPNGNDLLFQFAQQLEKREQQKKQSTEEKNQAQKDQQAKQIEDPNMIEQQQPYNDDQADDLADEYMFDEQAQQIEGKLATDKVQDSAHQDDQKQEDIDMSETSQKAEEKQTNPEEMTNQAALKQQQQPKSLNKEEGKETNQDEMMNDQVEGLEQTPQDLIEQYNEYLKNKPQIFDLTQIEDMNATKVSGQKLVQSIEMFDYLLQKDKIRKMFTAWQQDPVIHQNSIELLAKFKNQTSHVSASLCEQLRIVLEPQLSQNLQGDFKTGKRLNMKKVISFIASNYRNDKIWLRRTLPSKRDYKILIAIDDSLSMKESNLGFFSLEASVAIGEALNRLEVGKVAVARIRDRLELVQSFEDQYNSERAAHIISQFSFQHFAQTSADTSMSSFVSDANKLLDMQNNGVAISCPFVIVLSDGRFNKENVRRYMREAKEKKYLFIFVILDQISKGKNDQSIMSMRSAVKQQNGSIKLDAYLKDFPFDYYCVVQDISQLPQALGTILVQWFSLVSNQS